MMTNCYGCVYNKGYCSLPRMLECPLRDVTIDTRIMKPNSWIPIATPPDDERLVLGCVKDAYNKSQCPIIVYYDEGWRDADSDEIIPDGWIDYWMDIPDFDAKYYGDEDKADL